MSKFNYFILRINIYNNNIQKLITLVIIFNNNYIRANILINNGWLPNFK